MPLNLPLYMVVGEKLVSAEETADGGMALRGWDFRRREMTRAAVSWDDIVGHTEEGRKVQGSSAFAEGEDTFEITKEEFDRRLEELRGGAPGSKDPRPVLKPGVPEPLTSRRGVEEVSNLERSIRESDPHGDECCPPGEPPESLEKLRSVVKKIYGDDSPTR